MTLTEFLVLLAIVVILSLVAFPTFMGFVKNYRISAEAENLYYTFQLARMEAVKRNANVYVSFSPSSNWCYGVNVGSACDCTTAGSCGLSTYTVAAANQSTLSTASMTGNSIYFEGSHGAANASGSVTLTLYGTSS